MPSTVIVTVTSSSDIATLGPDLAAEVQRHVRNRVAGGRHQTVASVVPVAVAVLTVVDEAELDVSDTEVSEGEELTATVTVTAGGEAAFGAVTFYDGITALATVLLTDGVAEYVSDALAIAEHDVDAIYWGNDAARSATSNAVAFEVIA